MKFFLTIVFLFCTSLLFGQVKYRNLGADDIVVTNKATEIAEGNYFLKISDTNIVLFSISGSTTNAIKKYVSSDSVFNIWRGTQEQYDGISTKDTNTLYLIQE